MTIGRHFTPVTSRCAPVTGRAGLYVPAQAVTFSLTEFKVFPVRRNSTPIVICETPVLGMRGVSIPVDKEWIWPANICRQ
jgi:hypothetical protein